MNAELKLGDSPKRASKVEVFIYHIYTLVNGK